MSYLKAAPTPRRTSQREAIPGSDQVENSAGGYVWQIGSMERLRCWLVLGSEGGTYYASERNLTNENVAAVRDALNEYGPEAVEEIVAISTEGRAPKPDQAIYALAMACAHDEKETRYTALEAIPKVCRTGTHLFMFLDFVKEQRGWGRALKRGIAAWYEREDVDQLAYQLVKYRNRNGWTHKDAMRICHPEAWTPEHAQLFDWVCGRDVTPNSDYVRAFLNAQEAESPAETVKLIREYGNMLPREALQTEHLSDPAVMEALLAEGMPMTALIRNLASLTRIGVIKPLSKGLQLAVEQIGNSEQLRKAKVHPLSILTAMATYQSGQSLRGSSSWEPVAQIVDALDDAFYESFNYVEPTGKNFLIGLDVSGSMGATMSGTSLSCRAAAAAMAMTTARTEKNHAIVGFSHELVPIPISPQQRLDGVLQMTDALQFAMTDCALPMLYALEKGLEVDVFAIYTDNETYFGNIHPAQALKKYRERTGINAKLVVVGMTSTGFSIADPQDAGMLDCVGFDSATPQIIADFAAGRI